MFKCLNCITRVGLSKAFCTDCHLVYDRLGTNLLIALSMIELKFEQQEISGVELRTQIENLRTQIEADLKG